MSGGKLIKGCSQVNRYTKAFRCVKRLINGGLRIKVCNKVGAGKGERAGVS